MKSKRGGIGITHSQLLSIVIVGMILIILFSVVSAVLNPEEIQQQFLMKDTSYLIDALHAVPYVVQVSYSSPAPNSFVSLNTNQVKISSFTVDKDFQADSSQKNIEMFKDLFSIYTKSFWASTTISVKSVSYLNAKSFSLLKTSSSIMSTNNSFDYFFVQDMLEQENIKQKKQNLYVQVKVDSSNNPLMQSTLEELSRIIVVNLEQQGFNQPDATQKLLLKLSFLEKNVDLAYKTQLFYSSNEKEFTKKSAKSLINYLEPRILLLKVPQKLTSTTTTPIVEIAFANSDNSALSSKLLEQNEDAGYVFKQSFALRVVSALEEVVV